MTTERDLTDADADTPAPPTPPAEAIATPTAMKANPTTAALGPVFDFGEADLRANRQGRLSELQATRLSRRLMLLCIGGAAMFSFFGWSARSSPPLAGVMILLVVFLAWGFFKANRELRTREVTRLEGIIIPIEETGHLRPHYFYKIADQRLPVPVQAVDKIEAGQLYRVYVAPHSDQIISLERLDR